jgi:hypothetical protein
VPHTIQDKLSEPPPNRHSFYRTYKKELGESFPAAAYPLTETGAILDKTNNYSIFLAQV